ncbi:MAG TPA: hypothetical protein VIZ22_10630 [Candidatus Limnocylindrales bacterium]
MTTRDGFTRLVDTWLAEEGVQTTPDYLDEVLDRTSTSRQRPAWLSPGRWLPVDTTTLNPRAYSIPPAVRYGLVAVLLIIATVAALALYAGSQRPRVPAPFGPATNGRIYFDVDGAIVVTNADGSGRQTLDIGIAASGPYLSPDGTSLAFVSVDPVDMAGDTIVVAGADGSNARPIAGADLRLDIDPAFNPTWSPDGAELAFGAFHDGAFKLFVAKADGSGVRALGDRDLYGRQNPEWSTSGDWIAFMALPETGDPLLAVIRPDGSGERTLPTSPGAGDGFRGWQLWAPDDTNRLLYGIGNTADGLGDAMATMDVNAGTETILSDVAGTVEHRGAWSPDGKRIAFHLGDDIAVVNADGTGLVRLPDRLSGGSIGWSPDGEWIYGKSPSDREVSAIDASGKRPPIVILLDGAETGVFSWQRIAP